MPTQSGDTNPQDEKDPAEEPQDDKEKITEPINDNERANQAGRRD